MTVLPRNDDDPAPRPAISRARAPSWRPGIAAASAAVAGLSLIIFGLLTRRTDVAALGLPLVLGVCWSWLNRPAQQGSASIAAATQLSEPGKVSAVVDLEVPPDVGLVHLRVQTAGHRPREALLAARERRSLEVSMRTVRTGRRPMFVVDYSMATPDHLIGTSPGRVGPVMITVLAGMRPLRELPLPFRLQGMTGPHNYRRAGDGGDLHDVNEFTPGDRLRRIDWRVSARQAGRTRHSGKDRRVGLTKLFVRRTFTTADASVMLILDSRDDVGPDVATWDDARSVREDQATSLDLAREAASSLARRYLDGGDRVGLEDLGRLRRPVAPAAGRHQLQRLNHRLALAQPEGEPKPRKRVPRLPSGALIIVFSTFLDDDVARFARLWRHSGHRVMAVDVLPRVRTRHLPDRLLTAFRIVAMERTERLRALDGTGVEVVPWVSDGESAEVIITALARKRGHR